jgi:outer membrane lipoprotein-sorting protein
VRSALALALTLAAAPCAAARRPAALDAEALLRKSLDPAAASYEGLIRVAVYSGEASSVKKVAVRFQKPRRYRREVLDAAGQASQIAVSDGETEWIYDRGRNKVWEGEPADPDEKRIAPDDEFDLLMQNYAVTAASTEPVAGRPAWLLELRARADGRLQRRLWVDRKTSLVLASEDYRPQGGLASSTRFERVEFPRRQPKKLFKFAAPAGAAKAKRLDADFLALSQAKEASGLEPRTPGWLPEGYVFESLDVLPRGGSKIIHYRFSDGVNVLSLFQCAAHVKLDFGGAAAQAVRLEGGEGTLAWTQEGQALGWEKGRSRFLLVGALSGETLKKIAESVR